LILLLIYTNFIYGLVLFSNQVHADFIVLKYYSFYKYYLFYKHYSFYKHYCRFSLFVFILILVMIWLCGWVTWLWCIILKIVI